MADSPIRPRGTAIFRGSPPGAAQDDHVGHKDRVHHPGLRRDVVFEESARLSLSARLKSGKLARRLNVLCSSPAPPAILRRDCLPCYVIRMSNLAEIEAAVKTLAPPEQEQLFAMLAARLGRQAGARSSGAPAIPM